MSNKDKNEIDNVDENQELNSTSQIQKDEEIELHETLTTEELNSLNKQNNVQVPIIEFAEERYYNYSNAVITDRALPSSLDGMKPVHRRILYSMFASNQVTSKPFVKSARIVGDVLGKYHPHGDTAVYEAMVKLQQPFSKNYPLVSGQGNFGSIDGDGAAAMRYTEARLSKLGTYGLFNDINKDVVNFEENFDGTEQEPALLPVSFPNLWVNGSEGIAVGMATTILPHNLGETLDAVLAIQENRDISFEEIAEIIPAPDFPTGCTVFNLNGYRDALRTGRGSVTIRAKYHVEEKGKQKILIIDEIPYQVNKQNLIRKIKDALNQQLFPKLNESIQSIQDESSKTIRIAIALKRDAIPELVFNQLIKSRFDVQVSMSYNCMALNKMKRPHLMNIKDILNDFLDFRLEIVTRRTQFELNKALEKQHTLTALMKIVSNLDKALDIIKTSKEPLVAKEKLMNEFEIDDLQASYILDTKLQKITGSELEAIKNDFDKITELVIDYKDILAKPSRVNEIVKEELIEFKNKNADISKRKTEISYESKDIDMESVIKKEDVLVILTKNGYVKQMPLSDISTQNRNGKGKNSISMYEDDEVKSTINASTHDYILFFTSDGKVFSSRTWDLPEKGKHIKNIFEDVSGDVINILPVSNFDNGEYIVTVSKNAKVKKTSLSEYSTAIKRKKGIIGVNIADGDEIASVLEVKNSDQMFIVSSGGYANRFSIEELKETSRQSMGVNGMNLKTGQFVADSIVIKIEENEIKYNDVEVPTYEKVDDNYSGKIDRVVGNGKYIINGTKTVKEFDNTELDIGKYLLCIGKNGVGKKTELSQFSLSKRKASGLKAFNVNDKTGDLIKSLIVKDEDEVVITTANSKQIKIKVEDVRDLNRMTSGTYLMSVDAEDEIVDIIIA